MHGIHYTGLLRAGTESTARACMRFPNSPHPEPCNGGEFRLEVTPTPASPQKPKARAQNSTFQTKSSPRERPKPIAHNPNPNGDES